MTTLETHRATMKKLVDGEITACEWKAACASFSAEGGREMRESLGKLKLDELKGMIYYARGNKAEVVGQVYRAMMAQYVAPTGEGVSFVPYQETYEEAVQRQVETITDEMLAAYREERLAKTRERVQAVTDPQTLDQFKLYLQVVKFRDMTNEQIYRYDALYLEDTLAKRTAQETKAAHVSALEGMEIPMTVRQTVHTKRQCPIWIVRPADGVARLPKPVFDQLAEKALRFSARWSTWGAREDHGFIFWDEADANAFVGLVNGQDANLTERWQRREAERKARAADRLDSYAERATDRAGQALSRSRLTNTIRRVRMAQSAWASARSEQALADTCEALAAALASSRLAVLSKLRHVSQVVTLADALAAATDAAIAVETNDRYIPREDRRPSTIEDVRYTKFPWPSLSMEHAQEIVKRLKGVKNDRRTNRLYLEELITYDKGKSYVAATRPANADALVALAAEFPSFHFWNVEEWKRLRPMGIDALPLLRQALRELFPYLNAPAKIDPVRQAELDLVGLSIPGFFWTPADTVDEMVAWADIQTGMRVLEPSAGKGDIADAILAEHPDVILDVVEINYRLRSILQMKGHNLVDDDILTYAPGMEMRYDRIVGNPPFENGQDFRHLWDCYHRLLAPGGRMVFIVSNGAAYRNNIELLQNCGLIYDEELPAGTFFEAGTNITSRLVVIERGYE